MKPTFSIYKYPGATDWLEEVDKKTPAGRIGTPDDIANAVSFLGSEAAKFIFVEILVIDGGLSLI